MKSSLVALSTTALAWQCCQAVKMEEGFEEQIESSEQFETETLTLAQCSSAVKKVQETGKYTEEAILPICSSVVRSSKCDFFSEALSLATSHTDFNSKVFCKNIGEAHFCSQTMDRLLTSPVMADIAFGACMRDKQSKGMQYCQRFSKMHAYAVQHDDLDTMRACYMMEAYDDSDHEESKKPSANSTNTTGAPTKPQANSTNSTSAKTVATSAPKNATTKTNASAKVAVATKQHAVLKEHAPTKSVTNTSSKHNASSQKASALAKNASVKKNAPVVAKKPETSLVSSLIHTLSATVAGVAHAVAKVVLVTPPTHEGAAKSHNSTGAHSAQTAKALVKKQVVTDAPIASTASGAASLTQANKVGVKQTSHSSAKHSKVVKAAASSAHSVKAKAVVSKHHIVAGTAHVAKPAVPSKAHGKTVVNQHKVAPKVASKAASMASVKRTSSKKVEIRKKGGAEGRNLDHKKNDKDDKDKYGGFLSGFVP